MGLLNCLLLFLSSAEVSSFMVHQPKFLQRWFKSAYWALAAGFGMLEVLIK